MELSEQEVDLSISQLGNLSLGLARMFNEQLHTDITFLVSSGQRVGAHRVVLASQSDYFDCLLYGPMREGQASEITLEDTPAEAFRELLRFMYSGSLSSVDLTTALDLHILADRFNFPSLKEGIEAKLTTIISTENVLYFRSHAEASSAPRLRGRCEEFMDLHAAEVIGSRAVQQLPREHLKALIARDTFVAEEILIFDAVKRWMEENGVGKESAADLLDCVRLSEIPLMELQSKVLASGLYPRWRVLEAIGERTEVDSDCLATRGRTRDNINLFNDGRVKLTSCANYKVELLPGLAQDWSTICDFVFSLTISAARDPAHLTVQLDDVFIVNQLTFDGYLPEAGVDSTRDADRENSPFCYKVWVSRDGDQWVMVLDYSRFKCFSVQRLFFQKMAIRYVRILQSKGKEGYKIHLESCSYVGPVPYNFRDCGVIAPFVPMTPDHRQFVRYSENRCSARIMITFTQPYSITTVRMELEGLEGRADVSVSVATENRTKAYREVLQLQRVDLQSVLVAEFQERPVSIVSLTLSHFRPPKQNPPLLKNPILRFSLKRLVCQSSILVDPPTSHH